MPKKKFRKKSAVKTKKIVPAKVSAPVAETKLAEPFQPPRGMRDILPQEEGLWSFVKRNAEALSHAFGYGNIETPLVEHKRLFVRGVGEFTDIVQKEMYCFKDQGGDELCLRPENTAAIARAYINHGMLNLPQPVKLAYLGPMFRRDRPQAGRYRQFHQWGVEVLGDDHPVLDAEVISLAMNFMQDCGLKVRLDINSIGCAQCRPAYLDALRSFYISKKELLCEHCKTRLDANSLRLLDCKEAQCELLREGVPQFTDALCDPCREHFMRVLEYLDETEISYNLNPYIVRGLDYYNRTVFEIFPVSEDGLRPGGPQGPEGKQKTDDAAEDGATKEEKEITSKESEEDPSSVIRTPSSGAQSALGAGGRYDGLIEQLGGRPTPAVGFSVGLERVIALLKQEGAATAHVFAPRIFVAQLGEGARKKALALWNALRREVPAAAALSKDGLKAQLEFANRLGVRFTVIIGQKEIIDKTAIIRDMEAGIQEVVDYNKVVSAIKKKLE